MRNARPHRSRNFKILSCALSMLLASNLVAPAFAAGMKPEHQKVRVELQTPAPKDVLRMKVTPPVDIRTLEQPEPKMEMPRTLLDEVGRFDSPIPKADAQKWQYELEHGSPNSTRKSQLRIWLAEFCMRGRNQPDEAQDRVEALLEEMPKSSPLRGTALIDLGLTQWSCGRYRTAADTFKSILKSKIKGVDRQHVAMLLKHTDACAGYHEGHAKAGITEPPAIDPLCGASSIAVALRKLGMPYKEEDVVAKVPHTGFGSNLEEIRDGAKTLGLSGHGVTMSNHGLRAMFSVNGGTPVIAHVEHDHFIAVTGADAKGVRYMCSDCGAWPGGERKVTWDQWTLMEPDVYLALAKPGSALDTALGMLPQKDKPAGRVADLKVHSSSSQFSRQSAEVVRILQVLSTALIIPFLGLILVECGEVSVTLACDACAECPLASTRMASADPVKLAAGTEEYTAPGGLHVYNPNGPSVHWTHSYRSLTRPVINGWGTGWYHPYQTTLLLNQGESTTTGYIVSPTGARIELSFAAGSMPEGGITGSVQQGFLYSARWCEDEDLGEVIQITSASRTKYLFKRMQQDLIYSTKYQWYLCGIRNRMDQLIKLVWSGITWDDVNYMTHDWHGYMLTEIDDSDDVALLTLAYGSHGRLVSASDRYNRSIYYNVDYHANQYVPPLHPQGHDELETVSQVVETGTSSPPIEFSYTYQNYFNTEPGELVPLLHTISTVKRTTGVGLVTATIDYDDMGFVTDTTDGKGKVTHYESAPNNRTYVTVGLGGDSPIYYSITFTANLNWTQYFDYDGNKLVQRYFNDSLTPLHPSIVQYGVTPAGGELETAMYTEYFTYDTHGRLAAVKSPRGTVTRYTWDYTDFPLGVMTEVKTLNSAETTQYKTSTQMTYYEPSGLVHEVKTPIPGDHLTGSRQTTTYSYDSMGNVTSVVTPGNNAASTKTTTLDYGSTPKLGEPLTVTDPLGKDTDFTYTDRGQVESVTDPDGHETDYVYNIVGQTTSVTLPATGSTGSGQTTAVNTYLYPGGPITDETLFDEDGDPFRTVYYSYDEEGELTSRTGSTEPASFTYNSSYQLKSMSDGNSHTTNYLYDENGRPTQITFPGHTTGSSDTVTFDEYDLIGRLLEKTDGRGQTTTYSYDDDPDGNLSDVSYSGTSNTVHIEYDEQDRVTEVDDSEGTATSSYDDLDMVSGATRQYTGLSSKSVSYTYYPDGSRHVMSNPAGDWTYSYDLDGRCTSMVSPAGTSTIGYADNGWVTSRVLPNGSTTDYTYNAVGMMTSLTNKKSNGSALTSFGTTSYDGAFNLTGMTATYSFPSSYGGASTWTYDDKDQLTNETSARNGGWNHTNEYDDAGNPTKFKNSTRTYNSNNQLTTGSMSYDGNGNPTTYAGATLTYDEQNRVTSIGSLLTCGYRADGQRAWKQGSTGGKTYFLYDQGNPIVEMNSSGTVTATNVYAPDGLVARKEGSNAWAYYSFDMQGNVTQKLSPSEAVTSGRVVDAWGTGQSTLTPYSPDCFGYNAKWGYYYDTQTGLYLCQHRMYDASTGRWLNRDPIGYDGGVNLYGYCGNGAVGGVDEEGYQGMFGPAGPIMPPDATPDFGGAAEELGHGIATGAAAAFSRLHQAVTDQINTVFAGRANIIPPLPSWDGGPYKNEPGFDTSQTLTDIAIIAISLADLCELISPKGGVYQFEDQWEPGKIYTGQSGDMDWRLGHWESVGRKDPNVPARKIPVRGGRTEREIKETLELEKLGGPARFPGSRASNKRWPVSPARRKKLGF